MANTWSFLRHLGVTYMSFVLDIPLGEAISYEMPTSKIGLTWTTKMKQCAIIVVLYPLNIGRSEGYLNSPKTKLVRREFMGYNLFIVDQRLGFYPCQLFFCSGKRFFSLL